jgi:glyoxylase-like metal-dependent hydrolase (beta-lactamase superfamily II)
MSSLAGYVGDRVAGTVVLVRENDVVIVVDPGMVASSRRHSEPLHGLGVDEGDVTDVIFSHHHPDHTLNAALFRNARFHDVWAIYENDVWGDRTDVIEGAPSVSLLDTPGHTPQDISTLIRDRGRARGLYPSVVVGRRADDRSARGRSGAT